MPRSNAGYVFSGRAALAIWRHNRSQMPVAGADFFRPSVTFRRKTAAAGLLPVDNNRHGFALAIGVDENDRGKGAHGRADRPSEKEGGFSLADYVLAITGSRSAC